MSSLRDAALALRFALELAAIVAVGWWGFGLAAPAVVRAAAGLVAPLVVIVVWGAVVSPKPRFAVPRWLRLLTEVLVWLVAITALLAVDRPGLAVAFAVLVVVDLLALRATAGVESRFEPTPTGDVRP